LIIALTHLGLSSDKNLASSVGGINIIIGGHSHTVMWTPEIRGNTKIVQAGEYGEYVGKILLEYDAQNPQNYNFSYSLIEVRHPPLEENQKIKEIVQYYDDIISPIVDVKIGYTNHALSGSELGEMVAESFKERAWAEVGYQNSGGIRNYLPAGDIIIRQIHKALPFGNKLMSMDLLGSYLKNQLGYGYVAGAYQNGSQWYLESGEPIQNSEYYRVATNDYVGTRYDFIHGVNITYHGLDRDAFIGYIKDFRGPMPLFTSTPFKPHVNESITFIASASIPEWNGTHLFLIANYTWNFGDDVTITETDPTVEHAYTAAGNYTITLNVTDSQGLWNTTSKTITVLLPIHDIAITNVLPLLKTNLCMEIPIPRDWITGVYYVYPAWLIHVKVTVKNEGTFSENLTVTAYYNYTTIGTQNVTNLEAGENTTLTFPLDAGLLDIKKVYILSANATVVPGETDIADDTYVDGTVVAHWPGDANGDRKVNVLDLGKMGYAWLSKCREPKYCPNVDFNGDGIINVIDLGTLGLWWLHEDY